MILALCEKELRPRAIFDRLRLEHSELAGSHSAVKRMCRAIRRARGVQPQDVAIPVETAPGEIAQVDFGYVGKLFDPSTMTLRKAWCFVMVLAYSRHMVVHVVFDQRIETWLRLHVEAFNELSGVVETVVPDNLKAAVVRAAFAIDDQSELNRSYRELARHYGFKIDPTPPYDAPKKGKVEAGVKYVKGNFFVGRQESDVEAVRRDLRLYSVPWKQLGQRVWVRACVHTVAIYADDVRVATHSRRGNDYRSTNNSHLPDHRADLRHRSRAYWEERADAIGDEVGRYVRTIFDSDDVLSQLRTVQSIVTHLETFPVQRARAACLRAAHFGSYGYGTGKSHLAQAIGHPACRAGHTVLYLAAHDMLKQLRAARADNTYDRRMLRFTSPKLLIVDDLGPAAAQQRRADRPLRDHPTSLPARRDGADLQPRGRGTCRSFRRSIARQRGHGPLASRSPRAGARRRLLPQSSAGAGVAVAGRHDNSRPHNELARPASGSAWPTRELADGSAWPTREVVDGSAWPTRTAHVTRRDRCHLELVDHRIRLADPTSSWSAAPPMTVAHSFSSR